MNRKERLNIIIIKKSKNKNNIEKSVRFNKK